MIVVGFILTFVGTLISSFSKTDGGGGGGGGFEGGGVVLIGPIPIAFGSSGQAVKIAMILAVVIMVIWFTFVFLAR